MRWRLAIAIGAIVLFAINLLFASEIMVQKIGFPSGQSAFNHLSSSRLHLYLLGRPRSTGYKRRVTFPALFFLEECVWAPCS